jgi:glycine hydroxymethyltransferase
MSRGFKLITNGTDNHLIQADMMRSFKIDGRETQEILDKIGLSANCNSTPDDPLPPFRPSGLRLGTPAMTTRGLKEDDMSLIAEWMEKAVVNRADEKKLAGLKQEVKEFALGFPLPSDT